MATPQEQLETIRRFVEEERKKHGITGFAGERVKLSPTPENLLWGKLMCVPPGEWRELDDLNVLREVYLTFLGEMEARHRTEELNRR